MVVGELVALLVTVTLPETLPVAVGANATVKEVDWLAARVRGSPSPVTLKPLPVTLSFERVTLALPLLLSVTVCVALEPVVTLPKLSEVGEAEIWRTCATPVPDSGTDTDAVGELFPSVSVPENVPAAVGAKLTVHAAEPPAATVSGTVRPDKEKPVPDTVAWETVRLAVPGLEMVTVCVFVTPVVALPKLTDAGVTEIWG